MSINTPCKGILKGLVVFHLLNLIPFANHLSCSKLLTVMDTVLLSHELFSLSLVVIFLWKILNLELIESKCFPRVFFKFVVESEKEPIFNFWFDHKKLSGRAKNQRVTLKFLVFFHSVPWSFLPLFFPAASVFPFYLEVSVDNMFDPDLSIAHFWSPWVIAFLREMFIQSWIHSTNITCRDS